MKIYLWFLISALLVFVSPAFSAQQCTTSTQTQGADIQYDPGFANFCQSSSPYWSQTAGQMGGGPKLDIMCINQWGGVAGLTYDHAYYGCPSEPSGWVLDGSTCTLTTETCTDVPDCPAPQVDLDPTDAVQCGEPCPTGRDWNPSSQSCEYPSCPEGQTRGADLICHDNNYECPTGYIDYDPTVGVNCQPNTDIPGCGTNEVITGYNSDGTPICALRLPGSCPPDQVDMDSDPYRVVCTYPLTCPSGQTDMDPDPVALSCVQNPSCPDGFTDLDPDPQSTDCRSAGCPPGTTDSDPDPNVDYCVGTPDCPDGTHYNGSQCVNDAGGECPPGTSLRDGKCASNIQCPTGFHFDSLSCVPNTVQCPAGSVLTDGACVVQAPQCPPGTAWNGARCADPDGQTPPAPTNEETHACAFGTHWDGTQCAVGDPAGCPDGSHWTGIECGVNQCGDGAWGLHTSCGTGSGGTGSGGTGSGVPGDVNGDGVKDGLDSLDTGLQSLGDKTDGLKTSMDRTGDSLDSIKALIQKIEAGQLATELPASAKAAGGADGVGGVLDTLRNGLGSDQENGDKLHIFNPPSLEVGSCGLIELNVIGHAIPFDLQAGLEPMRVILAWYLTIMSAWWLFDIVSEPSKG